MFLQVDMRRKDTHFHAVHSFSYVDGSLRCEGIELIQIAEEFGQSGALPVALAAWAPAVSGLMLALALILHTEDG